MNDSDCIRFLQWALPNLRMRWPGFRKVRGQVCKRINARMREVGLPDAAAYRSHLEQHPDEWRVLDSLCNITISRFYRDRGVFQFLEKEVLLHLAQRAVSRGERTLRVWSIGCASGEEPYTLAILWDVAFKRRFPGMDIRCIATDADRTLLKRAKEGCYPASSVRELPKAWLCQAFIRAGDRYCVREHLKGSIEFLHQDVRTESPEGRFHLILCRNVVFTYFEEGLQGEILERIRGCLAPGGALVIGIHESLPRVKEEFTPWAGKYGTFLAVDKDQDARSKGEQGQDGPASPEAQVKERHESLQQQPDRQKKSSHVP